MILVTGRELGEGMVVQTELIEELFGTLQKSIGLLRGQEGWYSQISVDRLRWTERLGPFQLLTHYDETAEQD